MVAGVKKGAIDWEKGLLLPINENQPFNEKIKREVKRSFRTDPNKMSITCKFLYLTPIAIPTRDGDTSYSDCHSDHKRVPLGSYIFSLAQTVTDPKPN